MELEEDLRRGVLPCHASTGRVAPMVRQRLALDDVVDFPDRAAQFLRGGFDDEDVNRCAVGKSVTEFFA